MGKLNQPIKEIAFGQNNESVCWGVRYMPEMECKAEENGTAPFGIRELLSLLTCSWSTHLQPQPDNADKANEKANPCWKGCSHFLPLQFALCFSWH